MENNEKEKQEKTLTASDVEMRKLDIEEAKQKQRKLFRDKNKGKITGLALAVLTIASFSFFGFLKTLGIWIVMLVGYLIGAYVDRDPKIYKLLRLTIMHFKR